MHLPEEPARSIVDPLQELGHLSDLYRIAVPGVVQNIQCRLNALYKPTCPTSILLYKNLQSFSAC
eukprot:31653-Eustigmatos_ZCMA.PRE.1